MELAENKGDRSESDEASHQSTLLEKGQVPDEKSLQHESVRQVKNRPIDIDDCSGFRALPIHKDMLTSNEIHGMSLTSGPDLSHRSLAIVPNTISGIHAAKAGDTILNPPPPRYWQKMMPP